MATKKKTSSLACLAAVVPQQPLIKEYVNRDNEIDEFIQIHLPHIPHSQLRLNLVLISSENKRWYRANWYSTVLSKESFVPSNNIVASEMIIVIMTSEGLILERLSK